MAIVKMKRLRVVGMQEERHALLEEMQRLGCVEIRQIDKDLAASDAPSLSTPDSTALNEARNQHQAGALALEALKGYSGKKGSLLDPRPVISEKELLAQSNLDRAAETIASVNEAKQLIGNLQGEKAGLQGKIASLKPWEALDLNLNVESTANVTIQFGVLPVETDFNQLCGRVSVATELADLQRVSEAVDGQYVVFTCYTPVLDQAMEVVKAAGWSRANFRGQEGTARSAISEMNSRVSAIDGEIAQKEQSLSRLAEYIPSVQQYLDGISQIIAREEAQSNLLDTEITFYLEGWVEAEYWPQVESLFARYTVGYEVADPQESEYPEVPVKLKNSKFSRSLSIVTEMYSLPAYNGIDPNPLMAPFFIFFYGMMMADMGYGLLMIIATSMVLKKAKPSGGMRDFCELFRMLGYSTFAIGALTTGFFGNFTSSLLAIFGVEWGWFWSPVIDPMEHTIQILYASFGFGAIHVLTGMMVSFCKKAKDGKFMDGVMDEGSWWLLFAGIGIGATSGSWVVAYAGVAALVCTQGRGKQGIGRVVGGVASLYDITGYFGDILSYARLMALMLAGSVIAQVFNDLGVISGNVITFLLIAVAGNTLNFLLNLLGCFVHTLRLQCLEFFGKFYMDGGRAFAPLGFKTSYVDIQEQKTA